MYLFQICVNRLSFKFCFSFRRFTTRNSENWILFVFTSFIFPHADMEEKKNWI